MDEALAFLDEYAQKEYEAWLSTPESEEVFNAKRDAFHALVGGMNTGLSRPAEMTPSSIENARRANESRVKRKLFAVQEYKHPEMGSLFRAYMSGYDTYNNNDFADFFVVRKFPVGFRTNSWYRLCMDCEGAGKVNGKQCRFCDGEGFQFVSGLRMGKYGELVETRKLQPPADPAHRQIYDAL